MLARDIEDLPETFERFRRSRRHEHTPHYSLAELLDRSQLADKLTLAESRIVEAFVNATEIRRGRSYLTRGYIGGIGPAQKDLVAYVIDGCRAFVTLSELPRSIPNHQLRTVARRTEKDLVAAKVAQLVQVNDIWRNDYATGIWEIRPSLVDRYELDQRLERLIHKTEQQLRREHLHGNSRLRVVH